jgi:hypothetical protein
MYNRNTHGLEIQLSVMLPSLSTSCGVVFPVKILYFGSLQLLITLSFALRHIQLSLAPPPPFELPFIYLPLHHLSISTRVCQLLSCPPIIFRIPVSSIVTTCPAIPVAISGDLHAFCSSRLLLIPHTPCSHSGP